jgi:CO/xanthine dehydrogenase FAD-binding subunit
MPRFDYIRASSVPEALQLLAAPDIRSRPLAGGTDVLVLARHEKPDFDRVVDISRIPELKVIEQRRGADGCAEVAIGAGVTYTDIEESTLLREVAGCLVAAALDVGGPAIRNAGTLGGNVINAAACADSTPALVCLDAVAHLVSMDGARSLSVAELVTGANKTGIRRGELLTHFTLPTPPPGAGQSFIKLGRRNAQAISRLAMAAAARLDASGRFDYVRLAPGAAMPRTRRFSEVEALLLGQTPSDELYTRAGALTAEMMISVTGRRWSTEYKEVAIQALGERALRMAAAAANAAAARAEVS